MIAYSNDAHSISGNELRCECVDTITLHPVPLGMLYWTNVGVDKFIYRSIILVTLGNIVGDTIFGTIVFSICMEGTTKPHEKGQNIES